jgi:predicted RNA polymerase sigma factor
VQEALLAAAVQWPREGLPENPRAWLIRVAARRMMDHIRQELARRRRETEATREADTVAPALESGYFLGGTDGAG